MKKTHNRDEKSIIMPPDNKEKDNIKEHLLRMDGETSEILESAKEIGNQKQRKEAKKKIPTKHINQDKPKDNEIPGPGIHKGKNESIPANPKRDEFESSPKYPGDEDYTQYVDNVNFTKDIIKPYTEHIKNNEQFYFLEHNANSIKNEKFESISLSIDKQKVKLCHKPFKSFCKVKIDSHLDYFFIAYAYFCIFSSEKYEKKGNYFDDVKTKFSTKFFSFQDSVKHFSKMLNSRDEEFLTIYNHIKDPKFHDIIRYHFSMIKYKPDYLDPERLVYYSFEQISSILTISFNINYIHKQKVSQINCSQPSSHIKI